MRGYCIVFPYDSDDALLQRDYRMPRDDLIRQLEAEGPGTLQLPTQAGAAGGVQRYRLSEEERFGGYCIIDMTFEEYGLDPQVYAPTIATVSAVVQASDALRSQVLRVALAAAAAAADTGLNA